jgi:hypothetical protein
MVSVGYDAETSTLEVEFKNGRVYQYLGVEQSLFEWLLRVRDKGGVFQRKVRGQYEEVDVTPVIEQDLLEALRASIKTAAPDGKADES